jgi:hypothetical protein
VGQCGETKGAPQSAREARGSLEMSGNRRLKGFIPLIIKGYRVAFNIDREKSKAIIRSISLLAPSSRVDCAIQVTI